MRSPRATLVSGLLVPKGLGRYFLSSLVFVSVSCSCTCPNWTRTTEQAGGSVGQDPLKVALLCFYGCSIKEVWWFSARIPSNWNTTNSTTCGQTAFPSSTVAISGLICFRRSQVSYPLGSSSVWSSPEPLPLNMFHIETCWLTRT